MDPRQENSREYLRQVIDVEIKSLEESVREPIRALRHRRNALAPISSLPTEVFAAIFSFLRSPRTSSRESGKPSWLCITHVCHQWREIALNNPLFWSHIDFDSIPLAGAAEMLARAKKAPLHLEAMVTGSHWDDARLSAFKKELRSRVSHICHLSFIAHSSLLSDTLKLLVSPAPTLESLSLSILPDYKHRYPPPASIPDTLFDGATPRLSCLELRRCNISWKSPLLKGLRCLEVFSPSKHERPSLADWLDALDEMPRLKKLVLQSASPIAPPFPFNIERTRTVTLPFLADMDISASVGDCALTLSHLVLPALTRLYITAKSMLPNGADMLEFLPYVARHSHGPHDMRPLQDVLIRSAWKRIEIFAWLGIDARTYNFTTPLGAMTTTSRVALSVTCRNWLRETNIEVLDVAMAALPIDNLVKLTAIESTRLDEEFWRRHAPRWPLLEYVQLAPTAARGFREMILLDDGERECPLLPSLTNLDLFYNGLSERRTLRLCDALMKRVEQGVPLEELDLCSSLATRYAVQLLSEIVVYVRGPEPMNLATSRLFVDDYDGGNSEAEDSSDYDQPDTTVTTSDDSEEGNEDEIGDEDEEEGDYTVI